MKNAIRDLHVLVTRPKSFADNLIPLIQKTGASCTHFPLLNIERLVNADTQQTLRALNECDAVICISQPAAQFGLAQLQQLSIAPSPHVEWFAMGNSTADALRACGLTVFTPDKTGTSEALLALPWFTSLSNKRVMIWKGVGGREVLEQTLRNKGATVVSIELYQREIPFYAHNALDHVLIEEDINIIMITSGQALENLWQLANDKTRVVGITVMVPSERVANQARALGFTHVMCADGADDQSMLSCLQHYQMRKEANA